MRIRYSFLSLLRDMRFSRVVAGLTIAAILLPVYQPLSAASGPPSGSDAGPHGLGTAPGQALSQSIRKAKAVLENADRALTRGQTVSAEMQELAALRKLIGSLDAEVRAEFEGVGNWLAEKQLPQKIVARHENAVAFYREQVQTLLDDLALLEVEGMEEERAAIVHRVYQRLSAQKHEASQHPFNPAELPHEAQRPRSDNLPRMRREDFLGAGLVDTPLVQFAALEGYRFDTLPGADDPAYLGESVEVKLSAALRAKAEELGHDPVAIYHWVRNHVEWLPTWGAVQDAELTLSARRGNAMDIASLLISLLRASGIPARYVHGTIEVPEDAFRNWTGGFKHIEEAMNYAASGGIPITGMITGGRISHVRMEHIWVEAAVDFLPSRGAVMREADTWLPLDASYKQYEFLPGLDIGAINGINGGQLLQSLLDGADVDLAEGWVKNLDPSVLFQAQREADLNLMAELEGIDSPKVREIIGGKTILARDSPILPSGMPYKNVLVGVRYGSLPPALQPTISFALGNEAFGHQLITSAYSWAKLNNTKITLSFRPATEDDKRTLEGLVPEGGFSDSSQIPSSIPAYLINVIPELRVDGDLVLSGSPLSLGQELAFSFSVWDPLRGTMHYPNRVAAGSYLAIGVVGGSVSDRTLEVSETRLRATAEMVLNNDQGGAAGLNEDAFLGELFHAGLMSYFGQYNLFADIVAGTRGSRFLLANSAGTYGYVPSVNYFFGIPHSVSPGGVLMDLDRVAHVSSTDGGGRQAWTELNFQLGALASVLEHTVPEQMLVPVTGPGAGVSAVRALEQALSTGQRVYHITPLNQATALPNIHQNAATMSEIAAALEIGREVIVHTDPIVLSGWRGAGYVVFDPSSGAGAWKISGSANGGFLAGAGINVTIFGLLLSYKSMLAQVWGAKEIGVTLTSAANYLVAVNVLIGVTDISKNCRGPATRWVAISYTAITLTFIGATGAIAVVTGPVGGFAAGALFGIASGYLRNSLTESPFCG